MKERYKQNVGAVDVFNIPSKFEFTESDQDEKEECYVGSEEEDGEEKVEMILPQNNLGLTKLQC